MKFKFKGNTHGLEDLRNVPEHFHSLYVKDEDTGTFSLPEGLGALTGAVDNLNKTVHSLRGEVADTKKQVVDLGGLSEYGSSPDEILEAFNSKIEGLNALVEKNSAVNVEKIREETGKSFHATIKNLESKNEALTGQLHTMLVRDRLKSAISEADGNAKLLMPHLEPRIKVNPADDGKLEVHIYDEDGDLRLSPATGGPMSIAELVHSTKADPEYSALFSSQQKSGGGSIVNAGGRPPTKAKDLSASEKITLGLEARMRP